MRLSGPVSVADEAAQYRRLDHAVERHGLQIFDCQCDGVGCDDCEYLGAHFAGPENWLTPCGPDCPLHEARPQ